MEGIIIKGIGGFYYVLSNGIIYECKPRGIFRKENTKPFIGDEVKFEFDSNMENTGTITDIAPRKNFLIRPPISNISQAVLVSAIVNPQINFQFLNKLIVMAETISVKIILCFNKTDLIDDKEKQNIINQFINSEYEIIFTSVKAETGINELRSKLKNNISVFSGSSGVGKSSLLNNLLPDINLETGDLSNKVSRGKHTTRHVELFQLEENSFVADSPGFSSIDILKDIPEEELMHYYPEFRKYIGQCKFNSCIHNKEPGCAVKYALDRGDISVTRYKSYIEILQELQEYTKY